MQLRKSSKKKAKIKLALQGPSGSGKSYSALLLAYGLCGDWTKIAVIDSENNSADLYASLGDYNVVSLDGHYDPETYIDAIKICQKAGMEVIIIDSMSQCWDNLLEYHASIPGNSFTNWQKVTPRMTSLIQMILQADCHVISTMRCKQDYVLSEKNGKMVPEKVGLKAVMRDGIDYEYTIVFDINMKHQAVVSKDRTNLFVNRPEFTITPHIGKEILDWCNDGVTADSVKDMIYKATSIDELTMLYNEYPEWSQLLMQDFIQRKKEIEPSEPTEQKRKINNSHPNGLNHAPRTISFTA